MLMGDIGRSRKPGTEQFQLEALERLPCGCVVAMHSVQPSGVSVVSIEAKGPHCTLRGHRANKVIRLGEGFDLFGYDDAEEFGV
jgi:hypothetical protein